MIHSAHIGTCDGSRKGIPLRLQPDSIFGAPPSPPQPSCEGGGMAWSKPVGRLCETAEGRRLTQTPYKATLRYSQIRTFVARPSPILDCGRASSRRVTRRSPLGRRCGDRLVTPGSNAFSCSLMSHEPPSQEDEGVHGGAKRGHGVAVSQGLGLRQWACSGPGWR